ncbi:MAG: tRNA pseudouridine(55) synthase TruB [Planctomycetota bacterium]
MRRVTGGAKVGHAGTLDPLATGVLVLCLGKATKAIDRIMGTEKAYDTTIDLSAFSTTDDLEGDRTPIDVPTPPTRTTIETTLVEHFTGAIRQTPPAFSAVKVGGRRAYDLARKGHTPEIQPKTVHIHDITIRGYDWPSLTLAITCGKGTYIRSIARDLGTTLSTGGMLTRLVRTRVGDYTLDAATPLDDLPTEVTTDDLLPIPG